MGSRTCTKISGPKLELCSEPVNQTCEQGSRFLRQKADIVQPYLRRREDQLQWRVFTLLQNQRPQGRSGANSYLFKEESVTVKKYDTQATLTKSAFSRHS